MADATSPERAVVETWRDYSAALEQVRQDELRTLTPRDALAAADALLDLVRMLPLADG